MAAGEGPLRGSSVDVPRNGGGSSTILEKIGFKWPREREGRRWNTRHLSQRIGADALAAGCAGVLVAPVITVIDKGIIENVSGRNTLSTSIKSSLTQLLLRPHHFIFSKPFALIFSLYFGTYLTANAHDTISSTLSSRPASTTTSGPSKFLATSAANLTLCLYKDSRFTRLFGPPSSSILPVPPASYALFALRDCLTIFASFNLPPLIAPLLPFNSSLEEQISRASAAQFLAPAAIQVFSTPLHLLGLDMYNRQGRGVPWDSRLTRVRRDWGKSSIARMGRIIPAFGVGGVVNNGVRSKLMARLED